MERPRVTIAGHGPGRAAPPPVALFSPLEAAAVLLMRKDANIAREVAREAWGRFPGDPDRATERAIDWMRRKIGTAQLREAEALAEKLIAYWSRRKIAEPEAIFIRGEPGFAALSR